MGLIWIGEEDEDIPLPVPAGNPDLPKGCLMRQYGDFEIEVFRFPNGYVEVEKGRYQMFEKDGRYGLYEIRKIKR